MVDPNPVDKSLSLAATSLKDAVGRLRAASDKSKPAEGGTENELHDEIQLLYEESRDIYTRLAGLSAEDELGQTSTGS